MKKLIKNILAGSFVMFVSASSFFAFDWGGTLYETFKMKDSMQNKDLTPDWKNKIVLWDRYSFNSEGTSYAAVQASFDYEKDFGSSVNEGNIFTFDFDILKVGYTKEFDAGKFTLDAGRFFDTDLSGYVFAQNVDELKLGFQGSVFSVTANAGYTGLLNCLTASMMNEKGEVYSGKGYDFYDFAERYLVGGLTLSFPYLFAGQTVSLGAFDALRLENDAGNRLYGELDLNGGLFSSSLFYDLKTVFAFTSKQNQEMEMSNFSALSLDWYFSLASISLNTAYASGNNGPFKPFVGFTSMAPINSYSSKTEYSSLAKAGLAGSFKPLENLLFLASADAFFNINEPMQYIGFQYGASVTFQLFSDVSLGAGVNQYFDAINNGLNKLSIEAKASISF